MEETFDNLSSETYSVPLRDLIGEFQLEELFLPAQETNVTCKDVSRPGLQLTGFFGHFEPARIQIIGKSEHEYFTGLSHAERQERMDKFLSYHPAAVIFSSSLPVFDEFMVMCRRYDVPLLRTSRTTSEFMAALIASLSVRLAPRITRHGVLVEVYGEGILIMGDSGIGKSETAIELVKRGHRLIADDAVEIKRVSDKTLVGSSPEIIRHYIELRGIGIVDVRRIFGMGAVKDTEKIDFIINLENWVQGKMYDRLGLESQYTDILGIEVPTVTIPVHPGRNLAVIFEIAAMNNRQKKMGYNTAVEFNKKLMQQMGAEEDER